MKQVNKRNHVLHDESGRVKTAQPYGSDEMSKQ